MRVLIAAIVADLAWGEPPNHLHPVVWLGQLVHRSRQLAPVGSNRARFTWGTASTVIIMGFVACAAFIAQLVVGRLRTPYRWLLAGLLLKPAFAIRSLDEHVAEVERLLIAEDLPGARSALSRIVSRPTAKLDVELVCASAIESLVENTSDSIVAPILWYAVAGLPGAWAYRTLNTIDAMLGYRTPEFEWLGKFPARLDDIANLVPSRLTAAGFLIAGHVLDGRVAMIRGLEVWWRDSRKTASPNAGQVMAAVSGTLGVRLEKPDHYTLGDGFRSPNVRDLRRARRHTWLVTMLTGMMACALMEWWEPRRRHLSEHVARQLRHALVRLVTSS